MPGCNRGMIENLDFIGNVNHIGVATDNIEETAQFYISIGYHLVVGGYDPIQNVYGYFYSAKGKPTIELLAPYNDKSPINNILKKSGVAPYHLCYEITIDLDSAIKRMKSEGFMQISKPSISENLGNRKVVFFYNKHVGIVELLEHE